MSEQPSRRTDKERRLDALLTMARILSTAQRIVVAGFLELEREGLEPNGPLNELSGTIGDLATAVEILAAKYAKREGLLP